MPPYCQSRYKTIRRRSREVPVGDARVGGDQPIRVQSMTTTNTQDVAATVKQAIALAEVGCEIVRVTAPNKQAARALKDIRREFSAAGFDRLPLVADIHFLPAAAMEAVEHVEKVRVNPGNYADRKKFATREYTDAEYEAELQRLHEAFTPLVLRAKELGRSLRIGSNHGSLSDRIMNRYGDTPMGMVESAMEFLRIAESHGFRDMILSMKASNPKVMIQAYRLLVERMDLEGMDYPLHLGVTEAGDGEDGRIKSAIGIGSLLLDGLGDTIRVSLTEDSVYEIPVAQALADMAMARWQDRADDGAAETPPPDKIDPYVFTRRPVTPLALQKGAMEISSETPPTVVTAWKGDLADSDAVTSLAADIRRAHAALRDTPLEGVALDVASPAALDGLAALQRELADLPVFLVGRLPADRDIGEASSPPPRFAAQPRAALERPCRDPETLARHLALCQAANAQPVASLPPRPEAALLRPLRQTSAIVSLALDAPVPKPDHAVGLYRQLVQSLADEDVDAPIWIRNTEATALRPRPAFLNRLLEASSHTGSLLCDGIGDLVSMETEPDPVLATKLAYNILQGAGARISKTEFVACPSCGRTLFDLQTTTQRIREKTGHLKGVKIAVMGCIVNGPGEMADADFGYVGGAPGKINLYVGKECVAYNIPFAEADQRLIDLIKERGKWNEPEPEPETADA